MSKPILRLESFSKAYRSHWTFQSRQAVSNLSLQVEEGEAFGFLGHNGAGKTTTIKCIMGLLHKTQGSIEFYGQDLSDHRLRAQIGYLPEHPYFYEHLSVEETLSFLGSLCGLKGPLLKERIEEVLKTVHLIDRRNSSVKTLSKGLQQRVGIAQAIINKPKLLILDEPFSGLDPIGRHEVRELILNLRKLGTTIFMSSHILADVEDICTRVAILVNGRLKKTLELSELNNVLDPAHQLVLKVDECGEELLRSLREQSLEFREVPANDAIVVSLTYIDYTSGAAALELALRNGLPVVSFAKVRNRLEDLFVSITNEEQKLAQDAGEHDASTTGEDLHDSL